MVNENSKYYKYIQELKNINLSYDEFKKTNFWNTLKNFSEKIGKGPIIFKSNIRSMAIESDPSRVRIRNDAFLKSSTSKQHSILVSSFKKHNEIFHYVLSSKWFEKYDKNLNSSNSFIHFDFSELDYFSENTGYQYKRILKDKIKYIFLIVNDKDFLIDKLDEYLNLSNNSAQIFSFESISNLKNDPQIPQKRKDEIYTMCHNSCLVHKLNKDFCRTKIDWKSTNEAIRGTGLNVPLDFHHFIPRSLFKKEWLNNDKSENLDWNFIHSKVNLIPLCQICHQSIHSKNKSLSKETFNNIILSLKNENLYDEFIEFLKNTGFLFNLNDLLKFYLD